MSETHTSYEVSKRLKEFLGGSAPKPMKLQFWNIVHIIGNTLHDKRIIHWNDRVEVWGIKSHHKMFPAYQLHDLLSKPFCEAMENKGVKLFSHTVALRLTGMYYDGGIPAVEKALMEMMK